MIHKDLSPREHEIVDLCIQGLTNEAIAHTLGLSVGTVNTYWLRIRIKVGGSGRTDTVVRVIKDRAERILEKVNSEQKELATLLALKERELFHLRALLSVTQGQIQSTIWTTDRDLKIQAHSQIEKIHLALAESTGKSVQDIFKTQDLEHPVVAAHLRALEGHESTQRLTGDYSNLNLHVMPLWDETDGKAVVGCISILTSAEP